ncbi:MAG TPA: TonB-dependent receptor [Candidatus Acidoferrales bacterium]|nr:TonB-dependent receptor [Candidatus Acidoferrales bacterium]
MKRLLSIAILVCAAPLALHAQEALTGTITGTVLDPSGAAVPGAQVTARNRNTGLERSSASGDQGLYTIPLLPVGEYVVIARAQGFAETKIESVRVGVGQLLTLDLKLVVGAVTQTATVEAHAAPIETTRTGMASTVDTHQIANLGLNGRDFLNLILLTPGVTRDVRQGDLAFAGQRGTLNNLQVDGTNNNNTFFGQALGRTGSGRAPYQFSVDSVEEFQVNNNSFTAEFGHAGGAVINAVTKSGTNDFHGSGFWVFRDRIMNANTWINNSRGIPRQPFHVNQFGGTLGGPIVKQKDFFFFNYDGQRRLLPNPVFLGVPIPPPMSTDTATPAQRAAGIQKINSLLAPYTLGFNQDVYLVKNDWQISEKHRLSVRYNSQRFNGEGLESSGNQIAFEHSGLAQVITDTVTGSLSSVLTKRLLNEFRFAFLRDDEPGTPNTLGVETVIRIGPTTALQFGSSAISPRFTNIKGYEWVDNLTFTLGRHTLKAGTDIIYNRIANFFPGNSRGSYTFNSYDDFFASRPASFVQAFPGPGTLGFLTTPNFTELGFYVQDEFRVTPKLTLNYGLRYDLALWTRPPVKNPDPQLVPFGVDTSFLENDKNNFGPRLGFAYRPLDSNRLVVRGGYGLYYGRTPQILMSTAFAQNGISSVSLSFAGATIPPYPSTFSSQPSTGTPGKPSIFFFDHNYVLPLIFQGSLGFEYEVLPNTVVGASYLNVRGEHLSRTRDINFFPAVPIPVTVPELGTRILLRYPGRPMSNFVRVSVFDNGADSFYNGLTVTLRRRFTTRYQIGLSYTYSKTIDAVPEFTSVVPFNPIDEPKNPQYGLTPNLDRGPSVNDQRHRVVTNFLWDLDYFHNVPNSVVRYLIGGWQFSGIITAQTGQPYSNGVSNDPNNDSNGATDRVPGDGRNTNHAPTMATWDLRVTKNLPIYERLKLQLALDAFNAFNQVPFLASDLRNTLYSFTAATNTFSGPISNFATPARQTLDNRILQVSAKIVF